MSANTGLSIGYVKNAAAGVVFVYCALLQNVDAVGNEEDDDDDDDDDYSVAASRKLP